MQIIPATLFDLNSLRKLEKACFEKDAWPLFDLIAVLTFPEVVRLKAVVDGQMAGFVGGDPRPHEGWGWIATIGVDPRFQRRGIGRALLHACEAKLGVPRSRLTVRMSNYAAISLYEQEGYVTTDIWSRYYNDGEDGLVMEKNL
ncbi:MAG TPA: GNAT family N-acetyltransferase [Anaerolineales bacterium]|nr:GNAT family N-acetyltransferase [Anaerolineales bacterium]HMV97982.1 GNAT family N-acetyltransferase [Anaerolineales bacterium]HMX20380.1 GNAT family N-acetyltransferase [Anaerolineales bacterium]HMX75243.1 GNAT family N-acetyltransferase [Anaerolineales bacterium]HMZ44172.1 GNAT family N-acetyltransferase [Anaerolineales bacterium]